MELDGLLLDEEGTFSLSGFQEFTVSPPAAPPVPPARPVPSSAPSQAPGVFPPSPLAEEPRCDRVPGPLAEFLEALAGLLYP